jgi:hypothetical protein
LLGPPEPTVSTVPACPAADGGSTFAESVVVDPRDAERVFAVVDRGVFRTAPRGGCLVPSGNGAETEPPAHSTEPFALSVDPQQPDTLYLGSSQGVFKSIDGARSWRQRTDGIPFTIGEADVGRVAVDPHRSNVLYVGGLGVFKSVDGGDSWTFVQNGIPLGYFPPAYGFAFDPRDTDVVYLATYRLFKTTNGGELWMPSDQNLPGPVYAIAVDAADPDMVHAGTADGLFLSFDAGATWSRDDLAGRAVFGVLQHPASPSILYAVTDAGLFRRAGGGLWTALPTPFPPGSIHEVSLAASDPQTLYAATGAGVFRSRDGGASWSIVGLDRRAPRRVFREDPVFH